MMWGSDMKPSAVNDAARKLMADAVLTAGERKLLRDALIKTGGAA